MTRAQVRERAASSRAAHRKPEQDTPSGRHVDAGTTRRRQPSADVGRDDDQVPRHVLAVLAAATAIGSMGLAAGGTAGALLGSDLAGNDGAAGVPIGLLIAGSAAAALVISRWTRRLGRHRSLAAGYAVGAIGAALAVIAAATSSLTALLIGSIVLGAGNAALFLTRYAAAELGGEANRGRALGTVFVSTAVGAVAGPGLLGPSGDLARVAGLPPLAGLYIVAVPSFAISALLLMASEATRSGPTTAHLPPPDRQGLRSALTTSPARFALTVLAVTNLVMVAIMAIVPVHLTHHGHSLDHVGAIVGLHVAAMFMPSPVTGWAADRAGPAIVAAFGVVLLIVVGIAGLGLDPDSGLAMSVLLTVLGIGWNCGVIGASTLLTVSVPAVLRPHVEGAGEGAMGFAAAGGAPIAGLIVATGGFAALSTVAAIAATLTLAFIWSRRDPDAE